MYLEGSSKRFLLSAKSFDVGKYYISAYEGFPNIDSKPKCGYVAKVERQRDSSFLVSLEYCHLCDERLGKFCCGRSRMEREVVARISHSVKRYKKVNMEFRCISVTIPTISKSGTRKVWCPRSFRKVNPSLPNSADVNEALSCTPKMGMKLVSKLPEWNEDANNLVVRFQGSGRILVASAKNFLLYEDKYSVLDFGEQSMSHLKDPPSSPSVRSNNSVAGQSVSTTRSNAGQAPQKQPTANDSHASTPRTGFAPGTAMDRSNSDTITENDVDLEAIGGDGKAPHSPNSPQHAPLTNKNIEKLKKVHRTTSSNSLPDGEAAGDEASKSSRASSKKSRSKKDTGVLPDGSVRVRVPKKGSTYMDNTAYVNNATSAGATAAASGGVSPKSSSPRAGASTSSASTAGATFVQPAVSSGASTSGSVKSEKESQSQKESRKPPTANNAHKSDTMDAGNISIQTFFTSCASSPTFFMSLFDFVFFTVVCSGEVRSAVWKVHSHTFCAGF